MAAYATEEQLEAYALANAPHVTLPADPATLLENASRDIDRYLGLLPRSSTAPPPLKYDVTKLSADLAEGLERATCAQAIYRLTLGADYFIQPPGRTIQGPDFTIKNEGGWHRLGPSALEELRAYGLLPMTARARP